MIYRNVKTGAEINVASELGGDWEPAEETKKPARSRKKTKSDAPEKKVSDG